MMYWGDGVNGWGMLFMALGSLLFWGLVITGLVVLLRNVGRAGGQLPPSAGGAPTARQLLAERYARGEIDDEEYAHRLRVLESHQARD